jgi:hypothetical protein
VLRELFQVELFRFLRERELLTAERMELIRSWRHSGFDVYVGEPAPDLIRAPPATPLAMLKVAETLRDT